jgi:hypothetical protein
MQSPNSNNVFQVPFQEVPDPEPAKTLELSNVKRRPIIPGEGLTAYQERTKKLQEEASRLAMSSNPLFNETVQEFAARPGPESAPELIQLAELGRKFRELRKQKVIQTIKEMAPFKQMTKYFSYSGDALYAKVMEDLIEEESHIGGGVFKDKPKREEWRYFYENSSGQDELFFTRTREGQKEPFEVLRYIVLPNSVRKDYQDISMPVEGEELQNLVGATAEAFKRIDAKIYRPDPEKTGRHRA